MKIVWVNEIFFSPTGTTKRIVEAIARGTGAGASQKIDLTPPGETAPRFHDAQDSVAVIGTPVYGGRIPAEAVRRLRRIKVDRSPAVIVAVYGNRDYEDALRELQDVAAANGFVPFAAGAFIGEHSFSSETSPIAPGRPDGYDVQEAKRFGAAAAEKLRAARSVSDLAPLRVPGRVPYRAFRPWSGISPVTDESRCQRCGTCARVCPMGAISVDGDVATDNSLCILCTACVKNCLRGARAWREAPVLAAATSVSGRCRRRKEPEVFL